MQLVCSLCIDLRIFTPRVAYITICSTRKLLLVELNCYYLFNLILVLKSTYAAVVVTFLRIELSILDAYNTYIGV